MYVTYDTNQHSLFEHLFCWPKNRPIFTEVPWLVRVSDMTKVPGSEAKDVGYCTVSYPWSYSGDIVAMKKEAAQRHSSQEDKPNNNNSQNGTQWHCDDRGKHKLITYSQTSGDIVETQVKFESILQQICKHFGVEYLWYDKMCIDPSIKSQERHLEISNMHLRYRQAQFTIALIPEMEIPVNDTNSSSSNTQVRRTTINDTRLLQHCLCLLQKSEWTKRIWTYMESVQSNTVLFVGKNVHFSSDQLRMILRTSLPTTTTRYIHQLVDTLEEMCSFPTSAAALLRHAHARSSISEYEKLFALANILRRPGSEYYISQFRMDYERPLPDLMLELYSLLAQTDLTLLCFGKPRFDYNSTVSQYQFLPSWTGVSGTHAHNVILNSAVRRGDIKDGLMYVNNCDYITVTPTKLSFSKSTLLDTTVNKIEEFFDLKITHYIQACSAVEGSTTTATTTHQAYMSLIDQDDCSDQQYVVLGTSFDTKSGFICPVLASNRSGNHRSVGICCFTLFDWTFDELLQGTLDSFGTIKKSNFIIR